MYSNQSEVTDSRLKISFGLQSLRAKARSKARWSLLRLVKRFFAGEALFETRWEELHLFQ